MVLGNWSRCESCDFLNCEVSLSVRRVVDEVDAPLRGSACVSPLVTEIALERRLSFRKGTTVFAAAVYASRGPKRQTKLLMVEWVVCVAPRTGLGQGGSA